MTAARQAGFTLLEVLIALMILGIAIVASIEGFGQGLRLLALAGDHQKAVLLADQKVREVVAVEEGEEQGTEGAFRWERVQRALEAPDLVPENGLQFWRLFEIGVRVSWDPARHVEVRTLRMVPTSTIASTTTPGSGEPGGSGAGTTPGGAAQPPGSGRSPSTGSGRSPSSGSRPSGGGTPFSGFGAGR